MLLMMMMIDTGLFGQEALKMAVVCIFSLGRTDLKILLKHAGGGGWEEGVLNKINFHSSPLLASFYLLGQDWRLHYRSIYTQACIVCTCTIHTYSANGNLNGFPASKYTTLFTLLYKISGKENRDQQGRNEYSLWGGWGTDFHMDEKGGWEGDRLCSSV